MKVPIAWLRDYIDLPADASAIAEDLAALGFPVEHISQPPTISGVVVGRIVALARHPNADRLQLCTIDVGEERHLTIATAATNVIDGMIIPVARIGAQLPEMRIEPRKMRGVDSEGMLCSANELGLHGDWFEDGILGLDDTTPIGVDVVTHFRLSDPVLEVEVTSNRPDALCMLGIARELAAKYGTELRMPATNVSTGSDQAAAPTSLRVVFESSDVLRFALLPVANVQMRLAPFAMRLRLSLAGQRPINAFVDISNFVMLEVGQPLHMYDADKLNGDALIVRDARDGEALVTLDDEERNLDARMLVIADASGATGIAGVIGGAASAVSATTTRVVIECANFRGARIRRSAIALGARTEASSRFEKSIAPALIDVAIARTADLLRDIGAQPATVAWFGDAPLPPTSISVSFAVIKALLGFLPSASAMTGGLQKLGCSVTQSGEQLVVTPSPFRNDIRIAVDVVEEIARLIGFDQIAANELVVPVQAVSSGAYLRERELSRALVSHGFREICSLSLESGSIREKFVSADCAPIAASVEIRNPLSEDQHYLRFSLLPAMIEHLLRPAESATKTRFFEIGHTFDMAADSAPGTSSGEIAAELSPYRESTHALFAVLYKANEATPGRDPRFADFAAIGASIVRSMVGGAPEILPFDKDETAARAALAVGMHPGKCAKLSLNGVRVGAVGAMHPKLAKRFGFEATLYFGVLDVATLPSRRTVRYEEPSRYPSIVRDLALVVPEDLSAAMVRDTVQSGSPLIIETRVFDDYRSPDLGTTDSGGRRKSLAMRVVLNRNDGTLTAADADQAVDKILEITRAQFGATLRS